MKTLLLTLSLLTVLLPGTGYGTYPEVMEQLIGKLFQAKSTAGYHEIARAFEQVSATEKTEWLPLYYAALANILLTHTGADDATRDAALDRSQQCLDRAMALRPNESELLALQGFLYSARIGIDPMKRGILYIGKTKTAFDKAAELDPGNPRVYFLRAQMTLHMPRFVGGGTAKALPLFQKAAEKFGTFRPKTPFAPDWGEKLNAAELKKALDQAKE